MATLNTIRITAPVATILFCATSAYGQSQQLPTAATTATVISDTLTVFSEMNRSSEAVRALAKGDSVYVDLRIDQGGMKWCGVRLQGQTVRAGFVDCKSLQRSS